MSTARSIKQLGGETIIYGIAGTIGRFINVFLLPLYTRALSPTDNGYVSILTALATLLSTFIILGLDTASGRWYYDSADPARRRQIISTWFWSQSAAGLGVLLLVMALAPLLARPLLDSPALAPLVLTAALIVPLSTFTKVLGNWLRYQRLSWKAAAFFTLNSLAIIGSIVFFVLLLRRGVAGVFYGQIAAGVLSAVIAVLWLRGWIRPASFSWTLLREMLKFGLPLIPAALAAWVTASADRLILKGFVPASEIGIYSIGAALASGIALVTGGFQMAWGPFAFSILGQPEARRVYAKVFSIYGLLGALLCTALSLFAPLLLRWFTTPDYYAAAATVRWLSFAYFAMGATYIAALGCNIVKRSAPVALSIFVGAGINTLLNFLLIPRLGKDGAAIATLVAYAAVVVYLYRVSQKLYPIPYRPLDMLACAGLGGLLIVLDRLLIPGADLASYAVRGVLCLAYLPLAFGLGILRREHITQARNYLAARLGRLRSQP